MESDQQDQEEMSVDIAHYHIMANKELVSSNPETSNNHTTSIQPQVASIARTNKDASVSTKTSAFLLSNNTYKKRTTTYSSPPGAIQQNIHILQWDKFCIARNQL